MFPDYGAIAMAEAAQDPSTFEAALLRALRERMVGVRPFFGSRARDHVWIDEVRLVGGYPDSVVEVFLRDDRRPDCRFVSQDDIWSRTFFEVGGADPQRCAFYVEVFLQEEIDAERYGLSLECEPGVTTPIGNRLVPLEEASALADFWVRIPATLPPGAELRVIYEPNREFGHHQSVTQTYRWPDGELVVAQSANFRGRPPLEGWELIEHDSWPMVIWRLEDPTSLLVVLHFEDAQAHVHSRDVPEDELLTIARSLHVPATPGSPPG